MGPQLPDYISNYSLLNYMWAMYKKPQCLKAFVTETLILWRLILIEKSVPKHHDLFVHSFWIWTGLNLDRKTNTTKKEERLLWTQALVFLSCWFSELFKKCHGKLSQEVLNIQPLNEHSDRVINWQVITTFVSSPGLFTTLISVNFIGIKELLQNVLTWRSFGELSLGNGKPMKTQITLNGHCMES